MSTVKGISSYPPSNPARCAVTYISEDDPPLLLLHGEKDGTVFLDQSEHLHQLYGEAGVRCAEKALVLEFLKKRLEPAAL